MTRPPRRSSPRRGLALSALAAVLTWAGPAVAATERYALLVGNNRGDADDEDLRYAESDAVRLGEVLRDLGGFDAENVLVLRGRGAADVRASLARLERRIAALPGDALLLVYYSGHADAGALHLGGDALALSELERMVTDSRASVRLLVVDSCRSGALTRRKGGRPVAGFAVRVDESLAARGVVTLTSSSATEDAQESDELGASFFTHYLVSGLMGAADTSGDGTVSLAEAYRHAYESTLRATSRTVAGVQHATFRYDLSGHGDLPLTRLSGLPGQRAWIRVPKERSYLLLRGDDAGAVVAEVGLRDARRRISVRPGRYFVRGRGSDHLLEGTVTVRSGDDRAVIDSDLRRVEYARLVRKGGGIRPWVWSPELGMRARSSVDNSDRPCVGAFAGAAVDLPAFWLGARLSWCRSGYEFDGLQADLDELDLALRAGKAFDVSALTLAPFASVGGGLFRQHFTTMGTAPDRTTAMGRIGTGLSISTALGRGLYAIVEAAGDFYAFRRDGDGLAADFALSVGAGLGWSL
jgi:Caspase domain